MTGARKASQFTERSMPVCTQSILFFFSLFVNCGQTKKASRFRKMPFEGRGYRSLQDFGNLIQNITPLLAPLGESTFFGTRAIR
jgi:hypothetical protein